MRSYFKALLLLAVFSSFSSQVFAQRILFVTEDLPPLQIEQENKPPSGALIELINLVIKEADIKAEIVFYPWARSYELALKTPNTFVFSMLRSKDREEKFHWISNLFSISSYFVALKSRTDIEVNSVEDAKSYSVGSIRHYVAESYLKEKGFIAKQNLYVSSQHSILWQMLYSGRTDIAFTNSLVWRQGVKKAGLDPNKLKFIYQVPDYASDLYLAANLNTDKTILNKVKNSIAAIKADGRYNKIMVKWQLSSLN